MPHFPTNDGGWSISLSGVTMCRAEVAAYTWPPAGTIGFAVERVHHRFNGIANRHVQASPGVESGGSAKAAVYASHGTL